MGLTRLTKSEGMRRPEDLLLRDGRIFKLPHSYEQKERSRMESESRSREFTLPNVALDQTREHAIISTK